MTLPTIVAICVVALVVGVATATLIIRKKHGKNSCGCACENCAYHDSCSKNH